MTDSQQPYSSPYQDYRGGNQVVPNSTEVLVLGILSIFLCWCWGIVSIILGIVTIVLANQGERQYRLNPAIYSESSYRNLKAGKTCAIVGLCLAAMSLIGAVIYFIVFGSMFFNIFQQSWH